MSVKNSCLTMNDFISEDEFRDLLSPPPSVKNQLRTVNTSCWAYVTCKYPEGHNSYLTCEYQQMLDALPEKEYVDGIMKLTQAERLSLMAHEKNRRKTFLINWPHAHVLNLSGKDMAAAGLYFLGEGDKVQCAFCQGILHTWAEGDRPFLEHSIAFGFCTFIRAMNSCNVPAVPIPELDLHKIAVLQIASKEIPLDLSDLGVDAAGDNEQLAFQRSYSGETERQSTFYNATTNKWIWPHEMTQGYERLCKAGFVYLGHEDAVKCFSCQIVMQNWRKIDNPFVEHARWYPECPYLIESMGQKFINTIQKCTPALKKISRKSFEERDTVAKVDDSVVKNAHQQFEECLNRDLSLDAVIEAFEGNEYRAFKSVEDCIDAVKEIEKKAIELAEAAKAKEREEAEVELSQKRSSNPALCRVCELEKNEQKLASHVNLPCGHMVYCDECALEVQALLEEEEIVKCPFHRCGLAIEKLVQTRW